MGGRVGRYEVRSSEKTVHMTPRDNLSEDGGNAETTEEHKDDSHTKDWEKEAADLKRKLDQERARASKEVTDMKTQLEQARLENWKEQVRDLKSKLDIERRALREVRERGQWLECRLNELQREVTIWRREDERQWEKRMEELERAKNERVKRDIRQRLEMEDSVRREMEDRKRIKLDQ